MTFREPEKTSVDTSNGYENVAAEFIRIRGNSTNTTGVGAVQAWAASLPRSATVLDLGCGSGVPISKVLVEQSLTVYGIDASPTLATRFKENFPDHEIRCEPVEASSFYGRAFEGILAWGLLFLLPPEQQIALIEKVANHLTRGGKWLFTSPAQPVTWHDLMTGLPSESLGAEAYHAILRKNGLRVLDEYSDEGENYYYSSVKE